MNLLEDIQNAATDSSSDVSTLLRKCKILAARLENQHLEDWLIWESNGYPEAALVPSYRIWRLQVRGNFLGPFSKYQHAPIPIALLSKDAQKMYNKYECRFSIPSIESAIEESKNGMVQLETGGLALSVGQNVYTNMTCVECWAEFGVGNLVEVINAVRNRILDFSLALWKESPTAGETNPNIRKEIRSDKITQIFNTKVYGGTANLVGSANNSSVEFNIELNNFESVRRVLQNNGVSKNDIDDLQNALKEDKLPQSPKQFGTKVSAWISRMMKKASDGTWNVGLAAAGNLLSEVLSKYYGL